MVPFRVDPSWYERYWLSERTMERRAMLRARLGRAADDIVGFLQATARFFGYALVLLASGDFHLPRYDAARESAE
jgi:hypothetical protein